MFNIIVKSFVEKIWTIDHLELRLFQFSFVIFVGSEHKEDNDVHVVVWIIGSITATFVVVLVYCVVNATRRVRGENVM